MSSEVEEPVPSEEQQSSKTNEKYEEKQENDTETTEPVQQSSEKLDEPKENSELPSEIQDKEEHSKQTIDSDGENKIKEDEKNTEKNETQETQDVKESSGSRVNTPVERSASRGSEIDKKGTEEYPLSTDGTSTRPKSSGSGEVVLTGKGKRKKKAKLSADAHMVTFTVTISMAVPTITASPPTSRRSPVNKSVLDPEEEKFLMLQIKKLKAKRRGTYKKTLSKPTIPEEGMPDLDEGISPSNINVAEPPNGELEGLSVNVDGRSTGKKPGIQSKLQVTEQVVPSESVRKYDKMEKNPGIEIESKISDDQVKETSSIESEETTKSSKSIDIDIENKTMITDKIVEDDDVPNLKDLIKRKKRVFEAPRAQSYYHLEYCLDPDDGVMKTDVVTYGPAAKLFMDHAEGPPRLLKTWQEGDLTWIAWSHCHTVPVTKELLLKLFHHNLELRIWESKESVSTRARWDRPKHIKLPPVKPGEDENKGVKAIVLRQSRSFTKLQPKKSSDVKPLPTRVTFQKMDGKKQKDEDQKSEEKAAPEEKEKTEITQDGKSRPGSGTPKTLVAVPIKPGDEARPSFSRLGRLAGGNEGAPGSPGPAESVKSKSSGKSHAGSQGSKVKGEESRKSAGSGAGTAAATTTEQRSKSTESLAGGAKNMDIQVKETSAVRPVKRQRRAEAAAQQAAEHIKKFGLCMIPIRMGTLFSGIKSITNRLSQPVSMVEDVFISLTLDVPLLSEEQKKDLNPMIIKLHSATNLPDQPLSYDQLKARCSPVYCKYKFYKQPEHVTMGREHGKNVYWDDINVVLTGVMEPSELRQFLNGPPLQIEVHDRDRKAEDIKLKPTLFGDDLEDEKISNVGTVASRRTIHNPFKGRNKPWDPFGVAKLDLSELMLGHSFLYVKVPIHNCAVPEVLGYRDKPEGKLVGIPGSVDGPVDAPLPAGHYVHSNAALKIKIELAYPLSTPEKIAAKEDLESTSQCPFNRIVFKFHYKNTMLLHQLQNLVADINAQALELDDMPKHVIDAALSTYKLSLEQQKSRLLNIITGFQILDSEIHLFVLEGLRDKGVRMLWESLPTPQNSDVTVLYNSDLSFSDRLFGPLDVDLCRIKLHEPLSQIVQQPLLYVRDMVPKPCFEALVRLHEMTKLTKMKDAVRNLLFPTADMVISMSKEFGVPFTQEDFEELQPVLERGKQPDVTMAPTDYVFRQTSRIWTPIDHYNQGYMQKVVARDSRSPDINFIKENINEVKTVSELNKMDREKTKIPTIRADVKVAHNYSTQHLNSTELAKEKLRKMLEENPDTRYTYCQDYHHSMTVVPVNVEAMKKKAEWDSKQKWKTEKGFIYPGMKSMLESNVHPNKPDPARLDELNEEWRENILHVGMLQPPLDRDNYPWNLRKYDLELYKRPYSTFGREPVTIHLAGQKLKHEKLEALRKDYETWRSKIVVQDTNQYFHRCLMETELKESGQKSSNQIEKLKGLLKNQPSKYALRKSGLALEEIPPLNVVLNPSVDTRARESGLSVLPAVEGEGKELNKGFKPGPFAEHSWVLERNKIPAYDYEHTKFAEFKGRDFNAIHKEREGLWKKTIVPLTDSERDNHLFRIPDDPKKFGLLPELELGPRTETQIDGLTRSQTMIEGTFITDTTNITRPTENQKKMEAVVS